MLSLLSEVARRRPLLCAIDDAQWLDRASAQALAFAARRLVAEPVLMVFAARETSVDFGGLPELVVEGLDEADARALLGSVVRWPLDERVRERIVAETQGNPLALLELPRGLPPAALAGGFGLPSVLSLSGRIEESFQRRVEALPERTRQLLLLAAAEPMGDPALVWRAANRLGVPSQAAAPAAEAGLLEVGARVQFRHPLVRSAAYLSASAPDRAVAHRALAESTDPEIDPDRRAWHLAQATPGLDEELAAELERCAGRAQARGGLAASAAFLERAVTLTADPARRGQRALAAAQAKNQAGIPQAALRLVAMAEAAPLGELDCARVDLLRGQIAFAFGRGADAPALLLKAAKRLEPLDPGLARETYRDAFYAAVTAGRLATGDDIQEIAGATRAALPPSPLDATSRLLDGRALLITEGYAAGAPVLREALDQWQIETLSPDEELRWLPFTCRACYDIWDDEGWWALSARFSELARGAGALSTLRDALSHQLVLYVLCGELGAAASVTEEADAVSRAMGVASRYPESVLDAWKGREEGRSQLIKEATEQVVSKGEGLWLTVTAWATAVLYNGLGRYDEALVAAEAASAPGDERLGVSLWAFSELVEAAARSGQADRAAGAAERLEETTSISGTDWGLGIRARCRALLSAGDEAEDCYRDAVERLGRTRCPGRAGPRPPGLRRMVTPPEPPRQCTRAAPLGATTC